MLNSFLLVKILYCASNSKFHFSDIFWTIITIQLINQRKDTSHKFMVRPFKLIFLSQRIRQFKFLSQSIQSVTKKKKNCFWVISLNIKNSTLFVSNTSHNLNRIVTEVNRGALHLIVQISKTSFLRFSRLSAFYVQPTDSFKLFRNI